MAEHVYVSPNASGFRTFVTVEGVTTLVQFIDGNYRTDDVAIANAIDDGIAKGHLSRWVQKVDRSAAERLVQEHIAMRAASGAKSGQSTSQATAALNALQARDQELHKIPDVETVIDELRNDSDLMVTEQGSGRIPNSGCDDARGSNQPSGIKIGSK